MEELLRPVIRVDDKNSNSVQSFSPFALQYLKFWFIQAVVSTVKAVVTYESFIKFIRLIYIWSQLCLVNDGFYMWSKM